MIVLDTNVVSEPMRREPDPGVVAWLDAQVTDELYITSVTAAELMHGVERHPPGRRRSQLADAIADLLDIDFGGRILPFDVSAAFDYSIVMGARDLGGVPIGMADAMIAAVVLSTGAEALATRNTKDFEGIGLHLVDPWTTSPLATS